MNKELVEIVIAITYSNDADLEPLCDSFSVDICGDISCYNCPLWGVNTYPEGSYVIPMSKAYYSLQVNQDEQGITSSSS